MPQLRRHVGRWHTLDKIAHRFETEDKNYVPANLAPAAKLALEDMRQDHEAFSDRVNGITKFLQIIDHRPGWPREWLDESWWGKKDPRGSLRYP